MSRTTLAVGDSISFPTPTADDYMNNFNSNFNDAQNDFNRARDAITTGQKVGIGIGVTVAVLAILSVIAFVIMIMRKNRRRRQQIEQNEKMYEHHRVDPGPELDTAAYGSGGWNVANGYEMAGKSELGGAGIVGGNRAGIGEQYSGQVYGPESGRAEMGNTGSGFGGDGDGERRELGGREVRGELGVGEGVAKGGNEKVEGRRNDPAELP